ncbi:MAG: T9SS type A sorting domain-containing protein [Calditrichota bacterium]
MKRNITFFILFFTLVVMTNRGWTLEYLYISDDELTVFGDRIKFWTPDTLDGPVHSNSEIAIMGSPVFLDRFSTTAPDYYHSIGADPVFLGPTIFNAPMVRIPLEFPSLRQGAAAQGHFYSGDHYYYAIHFDNRVARMYRWTLGTIEDSTDHWSINLIGPTCIFIDGPVRVKGLVGGRVTVGSSQVIEIDDDIRYVHADPLNGYLEPGVADNEILGLVSEGDIKIRNTFANGRCNSGGLGLNQTNRDSTSVVITAALYALGGSFTFENQSDPDSGFVSDCIPDDRGTVYVYGGIAQQRRGYMHRSTNTSTGYAKRYRYDQRFRRMFAPGTQSLTLSQLEYPDTLNFGEVVVGTTVWDTAYIHAPYYHYLGSVYANYPFYSVRQMPFQGYDFVIPTRFTPPHVGPYSGILYVSLGSEFVSIVLRGRGVAAGEPLQASLEVSPNPFNLSTTFQYVLPEAGAVKLALYDVLGREAKRVDLAVQEAGAHAYIFDAAELASGVYFAQLKTTRQVITQKVLLVK